MKNSVLPYIIVLLLLTGISACSMQVPKAAQSNLGKMFPEATQISWSHENKTEFEAEFQWQGHKTSATFDEKGNWKETEQNITAEQLPLAVQEALTEGFADFVIQSPEKLCSEEYAVAYEMVVKNKEVRVELLFAPNGQLLKKKLLKSVEEDVD
ncbi:PepSY-like domain-containing protein [Prolixibacter bellariivorans]|nr:PepSY-like domain-containing protein [Prolixibacter bellariivorans]